MRITVWYTSFMLVLTAVVFATVAVVSYRLSIDNVEKDVMAQVSLVASKLNSFERDVFGKVESDEEFKNVSLYDANGKYILGQYNYDIANIKFEDAKMRRETIDGKEYIVYDVFSVNRRGGMPKPDKADSGIWIRGTESVNSTAVLRKTAFWVILAVIPVILLLAALGGYYISKKALLPINNIVKTAMNISSKGDVKQRIATTAGAPRDELYNLTVTLNAMLDKIEDLINREKQFTSDASHELRTPISVILAQGEYLAEIAQNEKEAELASNIVSKAKQMSDLVSKLLILARIDLKRQNINAEKVDLAVVCDIASDAAEVYAKEKNISITSDLGENLIVEADETLILSVFTNLISNAVKYGKCGGSVNISGRRGECITTITVKDDGMGISDEHKDKIWDRFYRADDVRNDEYASCGLGLAMVKAIVELHGGSVAVRSKENEGSEFEVTLKNTLKQSE